MQWHRLRSSSVQLPVWHSERDRAGFSGRFLSPCVWTRRHKLLWDGKPADQYERFFVARTLLTELAGSELDSYIHDYKWWTLPELKASDDDFAPGNIRELLPPILRGELPEEPFDCGV